MFTNLVEIGIKQLFKTKFHIRSLSIPAGGPDKDRIRILFNGDAVRILLFRGFFKEDADFYDKHFKTHRLRLFGYERRRWPDRRFNLYLLFFIVQKF